MKYCIINDETGICETPDVDIEKFPQAIKAPDDIIFGDTYNKKTKRWRRTALRLEPPTSAQLREQAYAAMVHKEDGEPLISWGNHEYTVDQATTRWQQYKIEKKDSADELQALVISAKEYIRKLYPEEVAEDRGKKRQKTK